MIAHGSRTLFISAIALLTFSTASWANGFSGGVQEALGPRFHGKHEAPRIRPHRRGAGTTERLHYWNEIAINASGLDHTPVAPGENRVFGENLGPGRASRAMAIVHIAIFDAVNAIAGRYRSYTGLQSPWNDISMDAAIAQAAHDTLAALYPSQASTFDDLLTDDLDAIKVREQRKSRGIKLGQQAAARILALRANDGAAHAEPRMGSDYVAGNAPGEWRQDPISQIPIALGAHWYTVAPFVLRSADQFRAPPPPALTSPEYTAAYNEAKAIGGDGVSTPTERTPEQTHIGLFWAYDGTPSLCAPTRLYNQMTRQIAEQMKTNDVVELARLLALVNVALADAGSAVWESKYFYKLWRPITAIREADAGTGPTGAGDGNPDTHGDPNWTPLGAPASNLTGPNFTPPFPTYPSGHGGFGGALFQTLRNFYKTNDIAFTFVSDEFNGETKDNQGNVRPYLPRHFDSLSEAEDENGQSRIYLGIHWAFDKTEAIAQGRRVANYVFKHAFQPLRR